MTGSGSRGYYPVIGVNWIFPICRLSEQLIMISLRRLNEVQAAPEENGLSVGLISNIVMMMESYLGRIMTILADRNVIETSNKPRVVDVLTNHFVDYTGWPEIEEVFVLRDAIVHNHIWDCELDPNIDTLRFSSPPKLKDFFGNAKFRKVLQTQSRSSKILSLNLFPTRINVSDVGKVVKSVHSLVAYLERHPENSGRNLIYVLHYPLEFRGERMRFGDFLLLLASECKRLDSERAK